MENILPINISFFSDFFEALLGGFDCLFFTLLTFIIMEYITGLLLSAINKNISGELGVNFIFKIILIYALIGAAQLTDNFMPTYFFQFRLTVIMFFIIYESIYIFENVITGYTCLFKSNK